MPSKPMSGAAAIDSIGPTDAKVTPIMTGSRMPTPGKPIHCTKVASPQANRSALIRKATSSGGSLSARPMIKGTATAPAYITSTCCRPSANRRGVGNIWSTGWISVFMNGSSGCGPPGSPRQFKPIQGPCQAVIFPNKACPMARTLLNIGPDRSQTKSCKLAGRNGDPARATDQEQIWKRPSPRHANSSRWRTARGQPAQRQGDDGGRFRPHLYGCRQLRIGVDGYYQEHRQHRRPRKYRTLHGRILSGAGEQISRQLPATGLGFYHGARDKMEPLELRRQAASPQLRA